MSMYDVGIRLMCSKEGMDNLRDVDRELRKFTTGLGSIRSMMRGVGLGLGGYEIVAAFRSGIREIESMAKNIDKLSPSMKGHIDDIRTANESLQKLRSTWSSMKQEAAIHLVAPVVNTAASAMSTMSAASQMQEIDSLKAQIAQMKSGGGPSEEQVKAQSTWSKDPEKFMQLYSPAAAVARFEKMLLDKEIEYGLRQPPSEAETRYQKETALEQAWLATGGNMADYNRKFWPEPPAGMGSFKIPSVKLPGIPMEGLKTAEEPYGAIAYTDITKALTAMQTQLATLDLSPARAMLEGFRLELTKLSGTDLAEATAQFAQLSKTVGDIEFQEAGKRIKSMQESADAMVDSLEEQAKVTAMVDLGLARNAQEAMGMIQINQAYGEGTEKATAAIKALSEALDVLTYSQKQSNDEMAKTQVSGHLTGLEGDIETRRRMAMAPPMDRQLISDQDVLKRMKGEISPDNAEAMGRISEMQRALPELARIERLAGICDRAGEAFGRMAEDMIMGAKTAGEAIQALANDIMQLVIRKTISDPISDMIGGALKGAVIGIGGGGGGGGGAAAGVDIAGEVGHMGGMAGVGWPTRYVPAGTFTRAPRLHEGLAADEFPAILQRGEVVLPKRKGMTLPWTALPWFRDEEQDEAAESMGARLRPRAGLSVGPNYGQRPLSPVGGGGGIIGGMFDMSMLTSMPRFHEGLAADEFPAILQRGETVIPRSDSGSAGVAPSVEIHMHNPAGQPVGVEKSDVSWDASSRTLIISAWVKEMDQNSAFRNYVKSSVRGPI